MSYECRECGEIFPEAETHTVIDMVEAHGATAPVTSLEYTCPYCGSEDVQEHGVIEYCIERCGRPAELGQQCIPCLTKKANAAMSWAAAILKKEKEGQLQ